MRFLNTAHHGLFHGTRCNYNCSYCTVSGGAQQEASWVEKNPEKIISFLKHVPNSCINLYGGEPTIWHEMPRLISECKNTWVVWTNLAILKEWLFDDSVKLIIASFHFEFADKSTFLKNISALVASGKRVFVKLIADPSNYLYFSEIYRALEDLGAPASFVPIEYQGVVYNEGFISEIINKHLCSTMYAARFFSTLNPCVNMVPCWAGTLDKGLQINHDGSMQRCAHQPFFLHAVFGDQRVQYSPSLQAGPPLILPASPSMCDLIECWCETNHFSGHTAANENERFNHYVETGEWLMPSMTELYDFIAKMDWNVEGLERVIKNNYHLTSRWLSENR